MADLLISLTRAENAFRCMKSPPSERPIFHHLEHRVESHIFLCVLAYHLLVTIETTSVRQEIHTSWTTVRDLLATHEIATIVLPTDQNGTEFCAFDGARLPSQTTGFCTRRSGCQWRSYVQ